MDLFLRKSSSQTRYDIILTVHCSIGDVIDAFMALMVLRTCQQVEGGLPNSVRSKMVFNIIVDFAVGLVPFIGDIADGARIRNP